jgi:hypothetical protein
LTTKLGLFKCAMNQFMLCSAENLPPVPDVSPPPKDLQMPLLTKFDKGWNASSKFLRPRIFCLEHAIQIVELLRSKGGSNVLVLCHSGKIGFKSIHDFGGCKL